MSLWVMVHRGEDTMMGTEVATEGGEEGTEVAGVMVDVAAVVMVGGEEEEALGRGGRDRVCFIEWLFSDGARRMQKDAQGFLEHGYGLMHVRSFQKRSDKVHRFFAFLQVPSFLPLLDELAL